MLADHGCIEARCRERLHARLMAGQHLPPDHSRGDESTVGGYAAVHARPAALEGPDGLSYSLDILTDATGDPARPWGACLLFVRWRRMGEQGVDGHLESGFLAWGETAAQARRALGAMPLSVAQRELNARVTEQSGGSSRRWLDAVRAADTP